MTYGSKAKHYPTFVPDGSPQPWGACDSQQIAEFDCQLDAKAYIYVGYRLDHFFTDYVCYIKRLYVYLPGQKDQVIQTHRRFAMKYGTAVMLTVDIEKDRVSFVSNL